MKSKLQPRYLFLTSLLLGCCDCFISNDLIRNTQYSKQCVESHPFNQRSWCADKSSPPSLPSSTSCFSSLSASEDIFIISWDGVIAKSTEWRISQGLDAALETWPQLVDALPTTDLGWLQNKMRALSHVMLPRPTLACDYALLARLLIEEQQLDAGRSTGANGKYARQFHPQTDDDSSDKKEQPKTSSSSESARSSGNYAGSRPLTVGEIAANWNNGGCLSETLLTRYHSQGQNPLPNLQRNVENISRDKQYNAPETLPFICFALSSCAGKVIITVGHWSDIPVAQKALMDSGLSIQIATSVEDALRRDGMVLLPRTSQGETSTVHQILRLAREGSTAYVIDSSFPALQKEKWLFGDDVPRSSVGKTFVGDHHHLSLNLAKWAENTHLSQHNEAEMDRWVNLITEEQFSELVSARIVKR